MSESILLHCEGPVARLTLNRPAVLNALDVGMAHAFLAACRELATATGVRVLVLQGAGRSFMAGGDLAAMQADPRGVAGELITTMHEALRMLAEGSTIVLAALHGPVAGAGLSLALAADLAIAASDTTLNLAYARIGASCDLGASWALPRIVGLRKAMEIALLSESMGAQDALAIGLVNRVVTPAALQAATDEWAQRLAAGPSIAQSHLRSLLRSSFNRSFHEQLDAEREAFLRCATTDDFREGTGAFLAKRAAVFTGH
jgi:2-(1,2-epoxy-1,2-dihydrophenyl)acetyl-CoA isomerase